MMILGIVFLTAQVSAQEAPVLKAKKDRQSYAIGVEVGRNFIRQGFDFNLDIVIKGIKDAATGDKLLLKDAEIVETLNVFGAEVRQKKAGDRLIAGLDNRKAGDEFFAENKTKEGVVTLPSGLQYRIITEGNGKKPTGDDTVEVQYRGTLINGAQFESTYDAGQPATINLSDFRVIAGLKEALKLMPPGSKWQIFVPPQLAYGQRGSGRIIGPYATLIFEIELLKIKQAPEKGGEMKDKEVMQKEK